MLAVTVRGAGVTVSELATDGAGKYWSLPGWDAFTVIVPAPVIDKVIGGCEPLSLPGPETRV